MDYIFMLVCQRQIIFLKSTTSTDIQSIAATKYYNTSTKTKNKIFGQYVFHLTSAS